MQRTLKTLLAIALSGLLAACAGSSGPSKRELILGTWEGNFQGQSVVLTYGPSEVVAEGFGVSFPYEWLDADTIKLDAMGQEVVSTVEFVGSDQMIQRSSQGQQTLRRVSP